MYTHTHMNSRTRTHAHTVKGKTKEAVVRQCQRVGGQDWTFQSHRGLWNGRQPTEMEAAGCEIIGGVPYGKPGKVMEF